MTSNVGLDIDTRRPGRLVGGDGGTDLPVDDDELTALALAADPETVPDPDAVSLWDLSRTDDTPLLPEWYMPAPMVGAGPPPRWWRAVAAAIIVAFVALNAYGLCSTYGVITLG